jgi:hypothetical protein
MCKNPLPPRAEKNLPLIFTDDADLKGIAVIAVIADIGNLKTQRLTTDFSDLKQKKTYRGFARMNADQEEKAKTFETQRNGGSGGNK